MYKNLWTALENSQLSINQRMDIARSIFEGKRFLNEEYRIVHTDLKASNIFLSENSNAVKIGDFGLSVGQGDESSGSYQIRQRKAESIWTRKLGYRNGINTK
jgi:serine/threonine protein kinase